MNSSFNRAQRRAAALSLLLAVIAYVQIAAFTNPFFRAKQRPAPPQPQLPTHSQAAKDLSNEREAKRLKSQEQFLREEFAKAELENAQLKAQLTSVALQKDEEIAELNRTIKALHTQVVLGMKREDRLLQLSMSRKNDIISSLISATSDKMKTMDAYQIAHMIDSCENFDNPERFCAKVEDGTLFVRQGSEGWRAVYPTFREFDESIQSSLLNAVEIEIERQKELFPMRKIIYDTCKAKQVNIHNEYETLMKNSLSETANTTLKELRTLRASFVQKVFKVFEALDFKGVDVVGWLHRDWYPVDLLSGMGTLHEINQFEEQFGGSDELSQELSAKEKANLPKALYEAYRWLTKKSKKGFDDTVGDIFGDPNGWPVPVV